MLKGTLAGLAEHPGARERYLVVLAMEAGEAGHADKALKLIAEFSGRCALERRGAGRPLVGGQARTQRGRARLGSSRWKLVGGKRCGQGAEPAAGPAAAGRLRSPGRQRAAADCGLGKGGIDRARLIAARAGRFRHMMWSAHPRLEGEMPGKASNVDWAARAACHHLRELGARCALLQP